MSFSDVQQMRLDFTSALYLGMKHSSEDLLAWDSLTTGVPAALKEPKLARQLSGQLAKMMGAEAGIAYPSTLHLFRDLFDLMIREDVLFLLDDKAYPISSWGIDGAWVKSVQVLHFPHGDSQRLKGLLRSNLRKGQRPVIVTDGWCPQCGRAMPLQTYISLLKPFGGILVIDDTQALGILGKRPTRQMPYGFGGGGILPWLGLQGSNIVIGSSLAKGFGVPFAVLAGDNILVKKIRQHSLTQVHCSPPSSADFRAAQQALQINTQHGDTLRQLLYQNVLFFKQELWNAGIYTSGGIFPVQLLKEITKEGALYLLDRLSEKEVQAILVKSHETMPAPCFILRADHTIKDIRQVTRLIASILGTNRKKWSNAQIFK